MKKLNIFIMVALTLLVSGCITTSKKYEPTSINTGQTPEVLLDAAKSQGDAVDKIEKANETIAAVSSNSRVKMSSGIIAAQLPTVKSGTAVLETEGEYKKVLIKKITALQKENADLKIEKKSGFRKFCLWLKIIGGVMIPLGIFLGLKLTADFFWVSVGGVLSIIVSQIITFIEKYSGWIIGVIILAIVWVIWRAYSTQGEALYEATKVAETTKRELKKRSPKTVRDLFGDEHTPGTIQHSKTTKTIIAKTRKAINKEWEPHVKVK